MDTFAILHKYDLFQIEGFDIIANMAINKVIKFIILISRRHTQNYN